MAEYCSQCGLFGKYTFDLFKMALNLENGHSSSFICEGCDNRGIYKDDSGKLFLAKKQGKEIVLHPINIDELIR